ncbi:uncharacterized protein G2W53_018189 [Senna tora]|uniref:Uncharacterized protein n=1 Tax=Senna tora TaxID=362788 RepID=A0A834TRE7_9FABA|nr:uncharacterized protein G2W53_018189 [Senna tora]
MFVHDQYCSIIQQHVLPSNKGTTVARKRPLKTMKQDGSNLDILAFDVILSSHRIFKDDLVQLYPCSSSKAARDLSDGRKFIGRRSEPQGGQSPVVNSDA